MAAPSEQIARPDFAVVVRGYDRAQVEAYFGRTLERLADADNRVATVERERDQLAREVDDLRASVASLEERVELPVPQSMSEFGDRMGQLMEHALEAARELRAQAEREARERRETVAREAEELVDGARAEAERIVERARAGERAMEEGIADLRAARGAALAQLATLHRQLADVLEATPPDEAPPDGEAGVAPGRGTHDAANAGATVGAMAVARAGADGGGPAGTVLETAEPTTVQPAVQNGSDAPTIVQPAVPGPGRARAPDETRQQPAVRRS
jgi:cell division septum initiation protein DivIVA